MGERKLVNKYIPPDFDPSKLRRAKKPKNRQSKIRTMLSIKLRCNNCGTHIPPGKKLNCRKETVSNKDYLGIPIFSLVLNGVMNRVKDEQAKKDNTKSLEEKALDLKRDMDIDSALDEIRLINSKRWSFDEDARLEALKGIKEQKELQEAEKEAIIKSINFCKSNKVLCQDYDGKEFTSVKKEEWNDNLKRRKVCKEGVPGFKTPWIRVSVNKLVVASNK